MGIQRRSVLKGMGALTAAAAFGVPMRPVLAQTPIKLTLPWLPLGTFSFSFVAKKMGFWEKRGLDVTIDRGFGSANVCIPVDQGQYEFGILDMAVMAGCVGRGLDLVAIAGIWPRSPIGIFSLKEYGITKPKDLEGQTVAFNVASGDFQLWPAFVKATGIDDSKVSKVTMDPGALIKALVDKQVKAEGNFIGSIAPSLWAQDMQINAIFYEDYGIRMFSNCLACKRSTIEEKPELCQAFVDGLMEGLRYVYLNPEESVRLHIESVKEFQGGSISNRKVIRYGQDVGTSLGLVPGVKQNGLGYMDPELVEATRQSVMTYMGAADIPPADQLATNRFIGTVKIGDADWSKVEQRIKETLPVTRG